MYTFNGAILGWDPVLTKESGYTEEINLPKNSEINEWFKKFAEDENLYIVAQAGFYWLCRTEDGQTVQYEVISRKTGKQAKKF
jgi:hypothetical protein